MCFEESAPGGVSKVKLLREIKSDRDASITMFFMEFVVGTEDKEDNELNANEAKRVCNFSSATRLIHHATRMYLKSSRDGIHEATDSRFRTENASDHVKKHGINMNGGNRERASFGRLKHQATFTMREAENGKNRPITLDKVRPVQAVFKVSRVDNTDVEIVSREHLTSLVYDRAPLT